MKAGEGSYPHMSSVSNEGGSKTSSSMDPDPSVISLSPSSVEIFRSVSNPNSIDSIRTLAKPGVVAAIVLLLGLLVRVWHLDYDQGMNSHPDERSNGYYALELTWPTDISGTLTVPKSTLSPFWDDQRNEKKRFTYGHFPLYTGTVFSALGSKSWPVLQALGLSEIWVKKLALGRTDSRNGLLMARLSIALLDTLTVSLVYITARKIYGWRTGLLASFLYAVAMLPVKDSHFFTFDPASATFAIATVLGCVLLTHSKQRWYAYLLAGAGTGLAVASKISSMPIVAIPMVAFLIRFWRVQADGTGGSVLRTGASLMGQSIVVYVLGLVVFAITSPFILLDSDWFWHEAVVPQGNMVRGVYDWVFTRQYRGTWPYLYFVRQLFQWGLWYPLGICATIGLLWTILRLPIRFMSVRRGFLPEVMPGELLPLVWIAIYFGITGAFMAKFNRYMLPILPMMVIFGASWLGWVCGWWGQDRASSLNPFKWKTFNRESLRRVSGFFLIFCVVGSSSLWVSSYIHGIWEQDHTWRTASIWIYENVPSGSTILWEAWDDPLPVPVGHISSEAFSGSEKVFIRDRWGPFEEDTYIKLDVLKEKLAAADYVIYSSNRIYDAVQRLPDRYPMTIAYYDAMFDGRLGFETAFESSRKMNLLGLSFSEENADESWSLYDHPKVSVLRKYRQMSDSEVEEMLAPKLEEAKFGYVTHGSFLNPLLDRLGEGIKRFLD